MVIPIGITIKRAGLCYLSEVKKGRLFALFYSYGMGMLMPLPNY